MSNDISMLGLSGYERNDRDLYPTPANVTEALCRHLRIYSLLSPRATVWEPACGDGQMVAVLSKHYDKVLASDIVPLTPTGVVLDFYTGTPKQKFNAIITNPPFGDHIDKFIHRGLHHIRNGRAELVAMLGRKELDSAVTRANVFGECPNFLGKVDLLWRPRWIADSTGSPRHNYSWYLWAETSEVVRRGGSKLWYAGKE